MKKAVVYARFSCSKQREASIEDQLRECNDFAAREGFIVVSEYCDRATSGRTDKRPEFQRMIVNAGESDVVIVYAMDRFSRDPYDAPLYKRELKKHGVSVLSATERISDTPEGMLLEKVIEGVAAMESAHNSIRTKRGMKGNAEKCLWNGVKIYGYDIGEDKRYVINQVQAENVREAFSRRIGGEAPASIARDFALRGVKTCYGNPCGASMVENMLRNRRYTGTYIWDDVEVEDGMPRIIDDETFEAVQKAPRAKRRKLETWRDYPLTGKSFCKCGAALTGKSGRGNGGTYYYYQCAANGAKGCGCTKPVRADRLEGSIVSAIREILSDDAERMRIAKTVEQYVNGDVGSAQRAAAQERLDTATRELENMMDAVKSGIRHPKMQEEIDLAMERQELARKDLMVIDTAAKFDTEDFCNFLTLGASMDDKTVLDAFVGSVVLCEDYAAVLLNWKNKENEPAYMEVDWFEVIQDGSPCCGIREPSIRVIRDKVVVLVPTAA